MWFSTICITPSCSEHHPKNRVKDEWNCVVETVVYNELISRGIHLYGESRTKSEIDFVAEKGGRRCYVQVAYVMASEATIDRELGALEAIGDSCPKYVVSMDSVAVGRNGIAHVRPIGFLGDESLCRLGFAHWAPGPLFASVQLKSVVSLISSS